MIATENPGRAAHGETMLEREFSHVDDFTGYMEVVMDLVRAGPARQKVLDIPAGQGLLAKRLRTFGYEVVCADINRAAPDYFYADMSQPLPFGNGEFDTTICMEGIEHIVDSARLIHELCRITKPGGRILLTLPNVQSIFSRFKFLCTGFFYQFSPWMSRQLKPGEMIDRGHIAPLSYLQLRYLFQHHGARVTDVAGDRWKKKWLIPLLLPFVAWGWVWTRREMARERTPITDEHREALKHLFSPPALFSRSLVLSFVRE